MINLFSLQFIHTQSLIYLFSLIICVAFVFQNVLCKHCYSPGTPEAINMI